MPRKNFPNQNSDQNLSDSMPELEEGEKVIITDTRTIEKKAVPANGSPTKRQILEIDDDDFDDFDDETDDAPAYSANSIAALIENKGHNLDEEFCTISIRREPDAFGDNFLTKNSSRLSLPPLRQIELTADRFDIAERVREIYGGGHYFFQIHFDGRLAASWKESLADSPQAVEKAKAAQVAIENAKNPQNSTQPATTAAANPFDQFFDTLKKQKEMKELLFGDEMRELERLREERDKARQTQTAEPPNEKLAVLQYAERMQNADLQAKVLGFVFNEPDNSGGILDTVKWLVENKDTVKGFAQTILGGLIPTKPPTEENLENLLKQAPPNANNPTPAKSNFKRRNPKAKKENNENA